MSTNFFEFNEHQELQIQYFKLEDTIFELVKNMINFMIIDALLIYQILAYLSWKYVQVKGLILCTKMEFLKAHWTNLALICILVVEFLIQEVYEVVLRLIWPENHLRTLYISVIVDKWKYLIVFQEVPVRLLQLLFWNYY